MEMKIGYIIVYDLKMNPHLTEKFKFREAAFTRRITSKGDRVYSKMLQYGLSGLTRQTQVSTTRLQSRRWSDGYPQLHSLKDAPMRQPR